MRKRRVGVRMRRAIVAHPPCDSACAVARGRTHFRLCCVIPVAPGTPAHAGPERRPGEDSATSALQAAGTAGVPPGGGRDRCGRKARRPPGSASLPACRISSACATRSLLAGSTRPCGVISSTICGNTSARPPGRLLGREAHLLRGLPELLAPKICESTSGEIGRFCAGAHPRVGLAAVALPAACGPSCPRARRFAAASAARA